MPEMFLKTIDSSSSGSTQVIDFKTPAFTARGAKRRAKNGGRIKGLGSPSVVEMKELGKGSIPGQKIYRVTVEGSI